MSDPKDLPEEDRPDDGVASDVKETIAPVDVPKDSPNRKPVEELVEEEGGEATRGNR